VLEGAGVWVEYTFVARRCTGVTGVRQRLAGGQVEQVVFPPWYKCVRDAQEDSYVVSRIDQARVDRILSEHDPFKSVS